MSTLKYAFYIALIICISLFAAKNMHTVDVYFFDSDSFDSMIKVPTMVLISCTFGMGFLMAWIFEVFAQLKLKAQLREKQKNIEKLEKELYLFNQKSDLSEENQTPISLSNP